MFSDLFLLFLSELFGGLCLRSEIFYLCNFEVSVRELRVLEPGRGDSKVQSTKSCLCRWASHLSPEA